MNSPAALGAIVSFIICIALTPVVRTLCIRIGAVDHPGPLKIHSHPTPRLGGAAVVISICAGLLFATRFHARGSTSLFAALALLWITGLADDLRDLSPYARLAAQISSAIILWLGGWRLALASELGSGSTISLTLVCMLVVCFVNSLNFLDGADGLAAGVAAIIGAAYVTIARGVAHDSFTVSVAACLAAACAAFLPFNWPKSRIFLGDSGSTVLGFCVALLALDSPGTPPKPLSLALAPFILAGLPVVDAALTVARRIRNHRSILLGDRRHLYDAWLARGWPPRSVALLAYAATIALAILAWLAVHPSLRAILYSSGISVAALLILAIRLGSLRTVQRRFRLGRSNRFTSSGKPQALL